MKTKEKQNCGVEVVGRYFVEVGEKYNVCALCVCKSFKGSKAGASQFISGRRHTREYHLQ